MNRQTSAIIYAGVLTSLPNVRTPPSLAAGKRLVIAVPVPLEGRVHRLTVYQETGTAAAFTVELLMSSVPYGLATAAQANYNAATAAPAALVRVIPQQTALSGATADWRSAESGSGANGHPYVNVDQSSRTEGVGTLYLVIIPTASANASTWAVALVVDQATSFG